MKNKILFLVLFAISALFVHAQTPVCTAEARYRDSAAGVYPLPVSTALPTGGINTPACIGKPYNFVWTVRVADSATIPNPLVPGTTITVAIDSVTLPTAGAIQNLPVGITYACNPPSCVFKKQSLGCAVLRGTATAANTIKSYDLIISGSVFGPLIQLIYPQGYPLTFPGSLADGNYFLKLYANGDTRCNVATQELTDISNISAIPNPTSGATIVRFDAQTSGEYLFTLRNSMGQAVISTPLSITVGLNTLQINAQDLPNGVYFYSISKGQLLTSQKLVVNH